MEAPIRPDLGTRLTATGRRMQEALMTETQAAPAPTRPKDTGRRLTPSEVGFIGLGRMGTPMAANLAAAGYRVLAYSRHPERAEALAGLGVEAVPDMDNLLDCEIVISMLPDDDAVREVVFGPQGRGGLATARQPHLIHLSMSTISPRAAKELAAEHARRGQGYVAAPVFGNPDAVRARELYILAAGAEADIDRCQPLLDILGQKTFTIGSDPAAANLIKLVGNVTSAATVEILGEVVALARKSGLDPEQVVAILTGTMFGGRAHRIFGNKIAGQHYVAGGFVLPLALKDVRLALAEAEAAAVPMPTVSVVRDRLIAGIARGYADLDWTALGLIAAEEAGLGTSGQAIGR
jgi:3-hydroxyisobutyrate dehydrogenase-like beta-hydroxyacid dehydrogenase